LKALPAESKPRRLTWLAAVAATLLAVVALLVLRQPQDVQLRGTTDGSAPPFSLRVYGKDGPGQKLHLIADFPGSKEATVSLRAELQYFVKPPPRPGETVLVESRSALKLLAARSEPADDLSPAGAAFSVGAFGPGEIEVCAALAPAATQSLAEAIKAGATKHCSTLLVTP
jgi:hypothetical protein